jgi:DNA mismatch endonuclease (patch repair protein)
MSRIRSADTRPERAVRSFLHRHGIRFRLHGSTLPGRPDIVIARSRVVVFVHGCFWHRHRACRLAAVPKTNKDFWEAKFIENRVRDRRVINELRALGWHVELVWECQVKSTQRLLRLTTCIKSRRV